MQGWSFEVPCKCSYTANREGGLRVGAFHSALPGTSAVGRGYGIASEWETWVLLLHPCRCW